MMRLLALAPLLMVMPLASAQAQRVPQGSYQRLCNNEQMRGPILTAVCSGRRGVLFDTQIDASQCNGQDIANISGRLICGGVTGQARPHRDDNDDDTPRYGQRRQNDDDQGYGAPPPRPRYGQRYGQPSYGRPDDDDDYQPRPRPRRYYDPDQDD